MPTQWAGFNGMRPAMPVTQWSATKAMSDRAAIGVGCRRGSSAAAIEALVRQALASASLQCRTRSACSPSRTKPASLAWSKPPTALAFDLVFLSRAALRDQAAFVQTRSSRAERRFGVPSVAEAAALAGAGPRRGADRPADRRHGRHLRHRPTCGTHRR